MAKIPLPERGIPLDVTYLYQIANAVNDISSQISSTTSKYSTIKVRGGIDDQNVKTSEVRIFAGYKDVVTEENVTAGTTRSFFLDYPSDFKFAPMAIATPVNLNAAATSGNDVTAVITSVTTSRVEGVIRFATTGKVSVSVNIMVIGVVA